MFANQNEQDGGFPPHKKEGTFGFCCYYKKGERRREQRLGGIANLGKMPGSAAGSLKSVQRPPTMEVCAARSNPRVWWAPVKRYAASLRRSRRRPTGTSPNCL
jgi:hypothetical protein